jgi:hypothetical protein
MKTLTPTSLLNQRPRKFLYGLEQGIKHNNNTNNGEVTKISMLLTRKDTVPLALIVVAMIINSMPIKKI